MANLSRKPFADLRRALMLAILLLMTGGSPERMLWAQRPPKQEQEPDDEQRIRMLKEMKKKANEQRQADLKRDTQKLLTLATELKQYVDQSNANVLSLKVISKADQIEKLAHSVKEKMKGD